MANFFKLLLTALIGVALGLISVHATVVRDAGFGSAPSGAWQAWLKRGAQDADPYARASISRFGEIPLGPAEGLTFVARHDDSGAALTGRCDYRLAGQPMPARFWSLSLLSEHGEEAVAGERGGFTSLDVVRSENGAFEIIAAPHARPGNWLPAPESERFVLMMQLYDTTIGTSASAIAGAGLPKIVRGTCR